MPAVHTPHIEATLSGCHALVLECNHDADMLAEGDYHYSLKQRVGGRYGHLNNDDAAALLARLDNSRLQHIVAAHLSRKNNALGTGCAALSGALGCDAGPGRSGNTGRGIGLARDCLMAEDLGK